MPLLDVQNLTTRFHTRNGVVHAVEDVSFSLEKGKTLGIVGESGSGKSVTCYSLLGLIPKPPGRIHSGTAIFEGVDLLKAKEKELRKIRGKKISMIFQDPMTCLNPAGSPPSSSSLWKSTKELMESKPFTGPSRHSRKWVSQKLTKGFFPIPMSFREACASGS